MADELVIDGKKLSDLKLVEIRRELGKRNLPKKGSKMVTLKRLEKAILEEKTQETTSNDNLPEETTSKGSNDVTANNTTAEINHVEEESSQPSTTAIISTESGGNTESGGWLIDTFGSPISNFESSTSQEEDEFPLKINEQNDNQDTNEPANIEQDGSCLVNPTNSSTTEFQMPVFGDNSENLKEPSVKESIEPMEVNETREDERAAVKKEEDEEKKTAIVSTTTSSTDVVEYPNFSIDLDDDAGEGDKTAVRKANKEKDNQEQGPLRRLESIASNIEPSYLRDEELIYEGDVEHESTEEEKDVLIVDVNSKELDLDSSQSKKSTTGTTASGTTGRSRNVSRVKSSNAATTATAKAKFDDNKRRNNLWVSGLAASVTAADLKTLLTPYGQVSSVKVVAKASCKTERFGFVVMGNVEQCEKCIKALNGTELKGKVITLELSKSTSFTGTTPSVGKSTPATTATATTSSTGSNNNTAVKMSKPSEKSSTKPTTTTKTSSSTKKDSSKTSTSSGGGSKPSSSSHRKSGETKDSSSNRSESQRIVSVENKGSKKETSQKKDEHRKRSRSPRSNRNSSPRGRIVSRISPSRKARSPLPPHRSRSPLLLTRPVSAHRPRRPRSPLTSPRRTPPAFSTRRGHIGRLGSPPPPRYRLGSPPPRHLPLLRSPPPPRRVPSPPGPPMHRLSPPPPRRLGSPPGGRRGEFVSRGVQQRLGGRMLDSRSMDLRFQEDRQRMMSEREREREVMRQEVRIERVHKEQELLHQLHELQERETEGRDAFNRQRRDFMELQKKLREREEVQVREMKAREMRERERNAAIERQKEKELREKIHMEFQQTLKEKEAMEQREKKALEKAILEKEQKLKEQEEKLSKYREELSRHKKEEEERKQREEERKDKVAVRAQKRPFGEEFVPPGKRAPSEIEQSIFGRLGGRDNVSQGGPSNIVKETHISPNLTYRRYETNKSIVQPPNRPLISNPYSQGQSRSKMESYAGQQQVETGYGGQHIQQQYNAGANALYRSSDTANVGYGSNISYNTSTAGGVPSSKAMSEILMNRPDILSQAVQALSNATRQPSSSGGTNVPTYAQLTPYGNSRLATPMDGYSQQVRAGGNIFGSLGQQGQPPSSLTPAGGNRGVYSSVVTSVKRDVGDTYRHVPAQSLRGGPAHNYKRN